MSSQLLQTLRRCTRRLIHTKIAPRPETDALGIPLRPTWSVDELLSSYPKPSTTPATLRRLHELSALLPPAEDTPEHDALKRELDELIRLVEAVKLVEVPQGGLPDGRICAEGMGLCLRERKEDEFGNDGVHG